MMFDGADRLSRAHQIHFNKEMRCCFAKVEKKIRLFDKNKLRAIEISNFHISRT